MSERQPKLEEEPGPARPPADWANPWRWLPRARWGVQAAYVVFLVAVAIQFSAFVAAAIGDGPVAVGRPPAVEAFLPIAALMAAKRFLLTGFWDEIHPAGLTILLAAVATALLARKAFCSWVCPIGTLSRGLEWLGRKTLWRRGFPTVPRWVDLPLASVKYLLLAFFLQLIVTMPLDGVTAFIRGPYNIAADAKMLRFFGDPSVTALMVLGALVLLSLGVKHFWCRYACPYGALLGIASFFSPLSVRRDPGSCSDCRACTRACPVEIPVHARVRVLSPECTGCMSCVAACTVPACLGVTRKGASAWPAWIVPAVALATMLGFWFVARATGFWETTVTPELFRWAYRSMGIG